MSCYRVPVMNQRAGLFFEIRKCVPQSHSNAAYGSSWLKLGAEENNDPAVSPTERHPYFRKEIDCPITGSCHRSNQAVVAAGEPSHSCAYLPVRPVTINRHNDRRCFVENLAQILQARFRRANTQPPPCKK